jgi:hypothetical protein
VIGALAGPVGTVEQQRRIDARSWVAMYVVVLGLSAVLGVLTLRSAPTPFAIPLTVLLLASALVAVKPVAGLYIVGFFTLLTDSSISPSYPFAKNLSSHESMLYLADSVIVSPLEIILLVTAVAWLLRLFIDRRSIEFVRGSLFVPMIVFSGFLAMGFIFGMATGGDRYAAIWEARPFLYLPVGYLLLVNLFTTRRQYQLLGIAMLLGVTTHAFLALQVLERMSAAQREAIESLVDHGSAVQFSLVIFLAAAAWLVPRTPLAIRWGSLLAVIPVGWVWLASKRRAAVIGLVVGLVVLGILLARLNRRALRRVGPIFVVVMVGYLGAFWHSTSTLGFPAQALKTVIAPGEISERDRNSDLYRIVENFDISATIHAKPITGLGFGHKFLRPAPLPDISFFPFWEYIPHNSVLWIWVKLGVGGFVAMLFLFGAAVRRGIRAALELYEGRDVLLVVTALSYLVMYLVFAYVDIAWDARSLVCVAVAMAICSEYLRLPDGRAEHGRAAVVSGASRWPAAPPPGAWPQPTSVREPELRR